VNPLPVAIISLAVSALTVIFWPVPEAIPAAMLRYLVLMASTVLGVITLSLAIARLTHLDDRAVQSACIGLVAAGMVIWAPAYLLRGAPARTPPAQLRVARVLGTVVALFFLGRAVFLLLS